MNANAARPTPTRGERQTLADGSDVEIQPLERRNGAALASAVARLSDRSQYLRFASPKPSLSQHELDTLTELDRHSSEALLATDPMTRDVLAVARFAALPDKQDVVDGEITVGDRSQRRDLGTALLARLIDWARHEGLLAPRADALAEDTASIEMLQRAVGSRSWAERRRGGLRRRDRIESCARRSTRPTRAPSWVYGRPACSVSQDRSACLILRTAG